MLAIRLQRQGRSGHAHYRVVVQDSRWSPKRGKVVAHLGSYDPHTKAVVLDKEKSELFIKNGAQPSPSVVALMKKEGVKLPGWVAEPAKKEGKIRSPEKLRKNQPEETKPAEPEAPADKPAENEGVQPEPAESEPAAETPESLDQEAAEQPEAAETAEETEAAQS